MNHLPAFGSQTFSRAVPNPDDRTLLDIETSNGGYFSLAISDLYPETPAVSSVALTDAHSGVYVTTDVIEVTVTMNQPVVVTGTPYVTLSITAASRHATFAGYGSDQTKLLFHYTVVGGDVALAAAFDITGSITLNGGTIKTDQLHEAAALTLTASDTSAVTVN